MENKEVLELLEMLTAMVTEAWGVPLGNDRCIIERDKALSLLSEIKARLPGEVAEARRIVGVRDEYVGGAREEAEAMLKSAQARAQELISEQAVVRAAEERSHEILAAAEKRTRELYRIANAYVDQLLTKTDETISASLMRVRDTRDAFRTAAAGIAGGGKPVESQVQRIDGEDMG
ncbi:MAG: hypothetical protein IJ617_05945 [Oscillospiraceae bacterium]|nr:hypothetical protein [Oscillospiraceae bacterium]